MWTLGVLMVGGALLMGAGMWRRPTHALKVEPIKPDFYLIHNDGMNVAALVTQTGVVLIDSMPEGWWGRALLEAVATVTSKPIQTIIHTHGHVDHVGNHGSLGAPLVDVLMHDDAKRNVLQFKVAGEATSLFESAVTFRDTMSIQRGGHRIDLHYYGPAHTGGDAWVVLPALRTMHVGDLAYKADLPRFDHLAGGSGVTYPATIAKGLAALPEIDTIVVGHVRDESVGFLVSREELAEQGRLGGRLLSATREAWRLGKNLTDAVAHVAAIDEFRRYDREKILEDVTAIYAELGAP